MDMAGLLDEPMRRIRITQATKPSYPPVILRVSKELCHFWRGKLKRRRGVEYESGAPAAQLRLAHAIE
jgi:hypothetical protein